MNHAVWDLMMTWGIVLIFCVLGAISFSIVAHALVRLMVNAVIELRDDADQRALTWEEDNKEETH